MPNINMIRIESRITEIFSGKIDLSDCTSENRPRTLCSRCIAALAIMIACGIDADIAAKSVTDGYHDLGLDAIYCDELQKKLILVQSKWRSEGTGSILNGEILSFVEGIKRIITLEFEGANKKIKQKIPEITSAIKNMDYQVECIFCHTGNQAISDYCMGPINKLLASTNDEANEILLFREIKQTDIFQYLASGQEADNISIDDVVLSNWGVLDEPYKAYYGILPAAALADWYTKYGNRLFAKNIRYYKGNTDVNQGIRKVLREEPENFFYYNNGIKILCKKISRKAAYSTTNKTGLFALEGVSLVNGAQTTGSIGAAYKEAPEQVSKASVFAQLIDLEEASDGYALQITRLSNTQNRIDSKEFAALDSEQERLKMELMFSGVYYLYKSGSIVEDPEHQISIDEAIVALACLQDDITYTATAKRNVGALTEDITRPPYKVLFNSNTNAFAAKNGVEILRCVDKYLQAHENSYQGRNRLALVHGNRFILYLVLQQLKRLPLYYIAIIPTSQISMEVSKLCDTIVPNVVDCMNSKYPDAYPAYVFKNIGRCRLLADAVCNIL